jgi:mitochondrial protein MSS2
MWSGKQRVSAYRKLSSGVRYQSILSIDKKTLRKLLYENHINLSYKKVKATYESCMKDDGPLPSGVASQDLIQLKNVLESYRKRTGRIERTQLDLERQLIERAAEMGNNLAVSLLCYMTLTDKQSNKDDSEHANKLLKSLVDQQHGPALKVSGDLAYELGYGDSALKFYNQALTTDCEPLDARSRTACLRAAGLLNFQHQRFVLAKDYLERAIESAVDPSQVYECHFYLSQLIEEDKQRSRYHLEHAARFGLKESFSKLGFLLHNYFDEVDQAKEWYKLGIEIGDLASMMGLFELYIKTGEKLEALGLLDELRQRADAEPYLDGIVQVIRSLDEDCASTSNDTAFDAKSFEKRFY